MRDFFGCVREYFLKLKSFSKINLNISRNNQSLYALLITIPVATLLLILIKPNNLGFSPDSMVYLEVAENILTKQEITLNSGEVVDHWPPLYSMSLAVTSYVTGVPPQQAGIILNTLLLAFSIIVYNQILSRSGIDPRLALASTILLSMSQAITNFLFYLSEGQFMVLLLVSFYFLFSWSSYRDRKFLILSGIFCGLLFLTRYAAVGFIGGFLLFILISSERKAWFKNVFYFSVALGIMVLPWFIYLGSVTENPPGRSLGIYLITFTKLTDALTTFGYWFLGSSIAIVLTGLLIIFYFLKALKGRIEINRTFKNIYHKFKGLSQLSILLIMVYFLFLIVSISFYDPWTPLDNRLLSLIFPFILILITLIFEELKQQGQKWLIVTSILVLFTSFSSTVAPVYINHFQEGGGYTSNKWVQSETIKYLKENSFSTQVYTNGIEIAKLNAGKEFQLLPLSSNEKDFNELINHVKNGKAQIIFFEDINWRNYLVTKPMILNRFENSEILEFNDGFIVKSLISE